MKLLTYMKQHNISDGDMASMVGDRVTIRAVRKWKYGETVPRLPELLRLEEVTGGAVIPKDFMPANFDDTHPMEQSA